MITGEDEAFLGATLPEEALPAFTAAEWITITGRGALAVIRSAEEPPPLLGKHVMIDGLRWCVHGIERTHPYNGSFGLLVRRRHEEEGSGNE